MIILGEKRKPVKFEKKKSYNKIQLPEKERKSFALGERVIDDARTCQVTALLFYVQNKIIYTHGDR